MEDSLLYVLDEDNNPVPCDDVLQWAQWWEEERILRRDEIGPFYITTIFFGLNRSWLPEPLRYQEYEPALFGTMVLTDDGPVEWYYERTYPTYTRAMEGHVEAIEEATQYLQDRTYGQRG